MVAMPSLVPMLGLGIIFGLEIQHAWMMPDTYWLKNSTVVSTSFALICALCEWVGEKCHELDGKHTYGIAAAVEKKGHEERMWSDVLINYERRYLADGGNPQGLMQPAHDQVRLFLCGHV